MCMGMARRRFYDQSPTEATSHGAAAVARGSAAIASVVVAAKVLAYITRGSAHRSHQRHHQLLTMAGRPACGSTRNTTIRESDPRRSVSCMAE